MSRDRAVSSSDVERARALSKRLGLGVREVSAAPSAGPEYIRFAAPSFAAASAPLDSPAPLIAPPNGPVAWAQLTGWVRELVGARLVVLSDASGLLVALSGDATHERAEAMGARLVLSFEQADRLEANERASRFMSLDFGAVVVSGLRVDLPGGGRLVLGIAAEAALPAQLRTDIERALAHKAHESATP